MAFRTSIPELNGGYYSNFLKPKYERRLIEDVVEAISAARIHVVSADNAGQLLSIILSQAEQFAGMGMPGFPSSLSTVNGCSNYVRTHPDMVTLLADVYTKNAYAWLCEHRT